MARKSRAYTFKEPTSDEQLAAMRAVVRESARNEPGVYRMIAENGEIVYVGKSKQIRSRLMSYFRAAYPEDKGARILRDATRIEWDYEPSEFAALLRELRLIKQYRPRFNVAMKRDARHYSFIKISRGAAPKLNVVRGAGPDDAAVYYGPFVGAQRVSEAVRELNDVLGLRDCRSDMPIYFADQHELFQLGRTPGCIRHEIRKCLGPCVGGCTVAEYDHQLALARAFLEGSDAGPADTLRRQMEAASNALEFERAAIFRDKLSRLEALREQFDRLRFAVESLSFVYNVEGFDGRDRTYVIRRGIVRAELDSPKTRRDKAAMRRLVDDIFGEKPTTGSSIPTHEIDELLLLSSWFRKFPQEMQRASRVA
ncbi:MAG TPA: GIY-YIG nuclease family protein [Gemmatimonadaceae bacterium]|nr:GIY-YIG nuclease family protein [Gemmatimonadaceae bacterium]